MKPTIREQKIFDAWLCGVRQEDFLKWYNCSIKEFIEIVLHGTRHN